MVQKVININVTPQLLYLTTSQTVCHSGAVFLVPTITGAGNGWPYTYAWTPAQGNTSSI